MGRQTIKGLATVLLATRNLRRATVFYHELLGLSITHKDDEMAQFDCGNVLLTLQQHDEDHEVAPHPNHMTIVLEVEDVDAMHELFRRVKARVIQEVQDQPWGDRTCVVLDPDGYAIELSQCMHEEKAAHKFAEA
ncbi:MAG: VOC family protein [bacterium]|nr:VOC family protein [bacterium]